MNFNYRLLVPVLFITSIMTTAGYRAVCRDQKGPDAVRINGCEEHSECIISGDDPITGEFDFKNNKSSDALRMEATAAVSEKMVDLVKEDACPKLKDASCPLEADKQVTYQLEAKVPEMSSNITNKHFDANFTMLGDGNEVIFCYIMNFYIQKK